MVSTECLEDMNDEELAAFLDGQLLRERQSMVGVVRAVGRPVIVLNMGASFSRRARRVFIDAPCLVSGAHRGHASPCIRADYGTHARRGCPASALRVGTDAARHPRPDTELVADKRFICGDCGVKWFVPPTRPPGETPAACGACGGALRPLVEGDKAQAFDEKGE